MGAPVSGMESDRAEPRTPAGAPASALTLNDLIAADRLEEALAALPRLLAQHPGDLALIGLQARLLRELGRFPEAAAVQDALVKARPGDFGLRFDLAETLLLLGDFERGWREYGHRYRLPHTQHRERKVQAPRWSGQPLQGRTILLHDEQGYGDGFQFLRLAPWVKARGAVVILQVHPDLIGLASTLGGYDLLIPRGALPPRFDLHCELMSLPLALGLTLDDLPGPIPYLAPDAARVARWRERLAGLPRPWVALGWAGTPTHLRDRARSLALSQLAPLAGAVVSFLSIQKGPKAAEAAAPPPGMHLTDLDAEIGSFDDTAAILQLADLLICVDSSPVHLAGALGRPVWTLLPFLPDWRWLTDRTDSPWYPTMRLYRQTTRGDWASVIARVAADLAQLAGGSSAASSGPRNSA
jgi:tetratricopeptide (TPR) repeat protein